MNVHKFFEVYGYTFPQDIAAQIDYRTYEKNEEIVRAGEEIDGLYFLVQGKYTVSSLEITGKELLLRYCQKPAILGDIELFEQCVVQSNCIAAETCEFIFIPKQVYEQQLKYEADFTQLLLKDLAYKLRTCTVLSRVNALSAVSVRLAAYFCTMETSNENDYITTSSLDEVAALIGTTKRHVNRILKQWIEEGLISRDGDTIQILDWATMNLYSEQVRFE
ncbi:MAG: Crp/Fnr family transcriptional regulator [Solibacillus sp.]